MLYIFNLYTLLSVAVGFGSALLTTLFINNSLFQGTIVIIGTTLCDLIIRFRNSRGKLGSGLFSHRKGGHIWFIPTWIPGLLIIIGLVASWLSHGWTT
jgi:hypothetical protein